MPSVTPHMSAEYLAGLFDGEGTVGIAKRYGKGDKGFMLTVGVTNTHEGVIRALCQSFGGYVYVRRPPTNRRHRECFQWTVTGAKALTFLTVIHAHLIIKKAQVDLVNEWCKHRITREGIRRPDVSEKRAAMAAIRDRLMALNHGRTLECRA